MAQIKFQVDGSQLRIMPISTEMNEAMRYERDSDGKNHRTDQQVAMADGRPAFSLREAKIAVGNQVYGIARIMTATRELPAAADEFAAVYTGNGLASVTISGSRDPYELSVTVEVPDITTPGSKRSSD